MKGRLFGGSIEIHDTALEKRHDVQLNEILSINLVIIFVQQQGLNGFHGSFHDLFIRSGCIPEAIQDNIGLAEFNLYKLPSHLVFLPKFL